MAIATLSIDIVAKLASLEQGLSRAGQIAERHAQQIERRWQAVGRSIATAFAALGAGVSVAAIANMTNAALSGVAAIKDLAEATGSTVGNISGLEDVAARTGATLDTVGGALTRLNAKLTDAGRSANSGAAQVFRNLGLDAAKLAQQDPAQVMHTLAQALARFEDNGTKARYVYELFGKSVGEVGPLLKDLADAGDLNATVTGEQAEQAERLENAMSSLRKTITDAGRALLADWLPSVNAAIERIAIANEVFGGFGGTMTAAAKQALSGAGPFEDAAAALAHYNDQLREIDPQLRNLQRTLAAQEAAGDALAGNTRRQVQALQAQRDEMARYAETYRRIVNLAGAGAGRGRQGFGALGQLPELPGSGGSRSAATAQAASTVEDYATRVGRALGGMLEQTPTAKLTELNMQLAQLDALASAGVDPRLIKEVRDALLPPAGADMGPPISDELRRVNELLQQTDGAKVAQLQRDMSLLMAARDNAEPGTARWQQLSDAILDADEKLADMLSRDGEVSKNIDDLGTQMQQTFSQGLGDTISRLMRGQFDSIGQMWASLLTEMAARAVAADLGKLMFGADGKGGWWSAIGTWLMSARGNVFDAGGVTPFASGGVVNRPTMFAYGGGQLGIMGEAGPEAIMPLKRGRDGKLGVAGGGGVVVNQTINVQAGVSRNEMMVAGEAIRRATMADIRDAMRRGQLATA
jgi:hypothetical protein